MIVFDLHCASGHRFEAWFGSSSDFDEQSAAGLVNCPECGTAEVDKAPMAPAVPAKGNARAATVPAADRFQGEGTDGPVSNTPITSEMKQALGKLAKAQEKALKDSTWVGDNFAEESRAMHYGERDEAPIHGQTSLEEAKTLADEGVPIAPLPFPIAPPKDLN
ncbi:MAG: DUF1178 family protein [Erythrobacter sp.]